MPKLQSTDCDDSSGVCSKEYSLGIRLMQAEAISMLISKNASVDQIVASLLANTLLETLSNVSRTCGY